MKIIGIAGTNGSGKDTAGHVLAAGHGFLFVSGTDLLRNELRRRAQPVDRKHLSALSAEWRRELGYGMLMDKVYEVYLEALKTTNYDGVAWASLRHPAEADRVHELGGQVWWIDADPMLRYQRIQSASRGRSDEDGKTYQEFLAEEAAEMTPSGDGATLNMAAVKVLADRTIVNGNESLGEYEQAILHALADM